MCGLTNSRWMKRPTATYALRETKPVFPILLAVLVATILVTFPGCSDPTPDPPGIATTTRVASVSVPSSDESSVPPSDESSVPPSEDPVWAGGAERFEVIGIEPESNGLPRQIRDHQTGITFRLIDSGTFLMGPSLFEKAAPVDRPRHKVRLSRPYYLSTTEVTVAQWGSFAASTDYLSAPERGQPGSALGLMRFGPSEAVSWRDPFPDLPWSDELADNHPVTQVSWDDASAFCRNYGYRLPTEAEWEFACRAGSQTTYWWGNDLAGAEGKENLWAQEAASGFSSVGTELAHEDGFVLTAPVGSYSANPWGIHDMGGNVSEWCADVLEVYFGHRASGRYSSEDLEREFVDPFTDEGHGGQVVRGSAFSSAPWEARSFCRSHSPSGAPMHFIGFRPAMDPSLLVGKAAIETGHVLQGCPRDCTGQGWIQAAFTCLLCNTSESQGAVSDQSCPGCRDGRAGFPCLSYGLIENEPLAQMEVLLKALVEEAPLSMTRALTEYSANGGDENNRVEIHSIGATAIEPYVMLLQQILGTLRPDRSTEESDLYWGMIKPLAGLEAFHDPEIARELYSAYLDAHPFALTRDMFGSYQWRQMIGLLARRGGTEPAAQLLFDYWNKGGEANREHQEARLLGTLELTLRCIEQRDEITLMALRTSELHALATLAKQLNTVEEATEAYNRHEKEIRTRRDARARKALSGD